METQTQTRKSFYDEIIQGQTEKFSPKKVKNLQVEFVKIQPSQAKHLLKLFQNFLKFCNILTPKLVNILPTPSTHEHHRNPNPKH